MSGMFKVCHLERLNISKSLYVWVFGLSAPKRPRAEDPPSGLSLHLHQVVYNNPAQVPLPPWVFDAIKRTFGVTVSPIKTPHGRIQNVHLIELSLIPSNCVIRMDEITLNATWFNTDRGGQGECLGLTIHRTLNRQSNGVQQHYCLVDSNESPRLLLVQMNYVCVTVLICDRHHLWGNVGHVLMHNKRFRLYSHPQLGRLASRFLVLIKQTIRLIWSNCCQRIGGPYSTLLTYRTEAQLPLAEHLVIHPRYSLTAF